MTVAVDADVTGFDRMRSRAADQSRTHEKSVRIVTNVGAVIDASSFKTQQAAIDEAVPAEVLTELRRREGTSGIDEKALRKAE